MKKKLVFRVEYHRQQNCYSPQEFLGQSIVDCSYSSTASSASLSSQRILSLPSPATVTAESIHNCSTDMGPFESLELQLLAMVCIDSISDSTPSFVSNGHVQITGHRRFGDSLEVTRKSLSLPLLSVCGAGSQKALKCMQCGHFARCCHSGHCVTVSGFRRSPEGQQEFATQTLRVHLHGRFELPKQGQGGTPRKHLEFPSSSPSGLCSTCWEFRLLGLVAGSQP